MAPTLKRGAVLALLLIAAGPLYAQQVTLLQDRCRLTQMVVNLPLRALWEEKGRVFEGCWKGYRKLGVAAAFFEDKTVVLFPLHELKPSARTVDI